MGVLDMAVSQRAFERFRVACPAVFALLLQVGCVVQPTFDPKQNHNEIDEVAFVHYVAGQPVLTFDEGCRVVLIAADGGEKYGDFEARFAELESRGCVRDYWGLKPNNLLDRGTLAYMVFNLCDLPHGVGTFLTQYGHLSDRRYALREMVYRKIMRHGATYKVPTGDEVLGVLASAEDYLAKSGRFDSGERVLLAPGHEAE